MTEASLGAEEQLLDALCRHATQMINAGLGPSRRVHVQAGELSVEIEWSGAGSSAAAAAVAAAVPPPLPTTVGFESSASTPTSTSGAGDEAGTFTIRSPMVGTFYRASEPGAPPFVEVGDRVDVGQQVGIVEAMKLMNPIEADRPGRVLEFLVENQDVIEFDQPLILVALQDA